ncbi:SH3 domain-containing protein [Bacillus infantis]|uniref:SH3 domain-containing protein n=1 Tax=Bacillus infantis TaxID=324767 RepID=UPI002005828A|nr:SH3 domain-containing protein [Bacillus infantis]MCK6205726.1 SH3 domain-containing protein [Bacillus infantis]
MTDYFDIFKEINENHRRMQKMVNPLSELNDSYREIQKMINPLSETLLNSHLKIADSLSPVIESIRYQQKTMKSLTRTTNLLKNHLYITNQSLFPVLDSQRQLMTAFETISKQAKLLPNFDFNNTITSLNSILTDESTAIKNIDFTGLDNLNFDSIPEMRQEPLQDGISDLASTVTIAKPKKKLVDMDEAELGKVIKKHVNAGTLSLAGLVIWLFEDYVKETALLLLEVIFAFSITIFTGQFDAEVKVAIENRIEQSNTYRDARKVITRYVKVNPYGQVAFIRKETYLRKGASKKAPVVSRLKPHTNTVLTIVNRKTNWLKVSIDTGNSCGEIGWVEESKVVKFKKMN